MSVQNTDQRNGPGNEVNVGVQMAPRRPRVAYATRLYRRHGVPRYRKPQRRSQIDHGRGQNQARDPYIDRLVRAAKPDLLSVDNGKRILSLATLQRMILFQLQVEIIEMVGPLAKGQAEDGSPLKDKKLRRAVADYTQAVRDWELMATYASGRGAHTKNDPFRISSQAPLIEEAMLSADLVEKDKTQQVVVRNHGEYGKGTLQTKAGTFQPRFRHNEERSKRALVKRFGIALAAGIALIAPVLLMVLHKDLTTALATTSVATFLLAAFVAGFSNASPEALMGAVAAYTAVLVVFVGAFLNTLQPS
ncbi:hypothetical protein GGR57DRAFT_506632 [Xylariaceae sp. FL1272]|nr:hypothetical protein GGR57DRAFT_506632 [Xylariaceae sp. FL1272]